MALEPIARTVACPLFGDAAEILYSADIIDDEVRRENSESAFDSFVGTNEVYSRSNELIVYGASPDFGDVYVKSKQFIAIFFSSYFANFDLQKIKGAKPQTWRLS